jgi:hypothetical protein
MVVAVAALLVALSGTAVAAGHLARGDSLIAKNSLSGNRLRNHTLSGTQINLSKLGKVNSAKKADTATNATNATTAATATNATTAATATNATTAATATNATTAATATNALSLGGIAASGYTRNDCSSVTGQIKGFVLVPASTTFSSTLTNVAGAYNCSGQAVQARRIGVGDYEVKFLGSPVTIALGNIVDPSTITDHAFVSFTQIGAGDFEVLEFNAVLAAAQDRQFSVVTP